MHGWNIAKMQHSLVDDYWPIDVFHSMLGNDINRAILDEVRSTKKFHGLTFTSEVE
jgi:hypothetical protein